MDLKILLSHHRHHVYTTRDLIDGRVEYRFDKPTTIDQFGITLLGKASICLKDHHPTSTTRSYIHRDHTFLQMSQPIEPADLPPDGIVQRRQKYSVPFAFTVPDSLLPHACGCDQDGNSTASKDHLCLPPSLNSLSSPKSIFHKSSGSRGTRVAYTVDVSFRMWFTDGTFRMIRKGKKFCVLPSSAGLTDIRPTERRLDHHHGEEWRTARGGKVDDRSSAQLEASIPQVLDLELSLSQEESTGSGRSLIPVNLRWQSSKPNRSPPKISTVTVKLVSTTAWGLEVEKDRTSGCYPKFGQRRSKCTVFVEDIDLQGLAWTACAPSAPNLGGCRERQPGTTAPVHPLYQTEDKDATTFSTAFRIPFAVPPKVVGEHTALLPSFSSCTVSRKYRIELAFSYKSEPNKIRRRRNVLVIEAPLRVHYGGSVACAGSPADFSPIEDGLASKIAACVHLEASHEALPVYTATVRS